MVDVDAESFHYHLVLHSRDAMDTQCCGDCFAVAAAYRNDNRRRAEGNGAFLPTRPRHDEPRRAVPAVLDYVAR